MPKEVEDAEILSKFQDEKTRNEAFNMLLKKYQQKIYWHVRRMVIDHDDADDLVQDVFIKVWKNLAGFRSDAQLYTWMYRIATNECITFLNKKKQKNNISLDDVAYELADTLADSAYFNGDAAQRGIALDLLQGIGVGLHPLRDLGLLVRIGGGLEIEVGAIARGLLAQVRALLVQVLDPLHRFNNFHGFASSPE